MSNYDAWLRQLAADQKGGILFPAIDRGGAYSLLLHIPIDVSGDAFAAMVRQEPDSAGDPAATFTATVGAFDSGYTRVTLSLAKELTAALPADADADGVEHLAFDVLWTPAGGTQTRLMGGIIPVTGKVTNYV